MRNEGLLGVCSDGLPGPVLSRQATSSAGEGERE